MIPYLIKAQLLEHYIFVSFFRVIIQREEEPPKNRERKQMTTNPISDDIFTQETVRLPEQKKRIELSAFSVN